MNEATMGRKIGFVVTREDMGETSSIDINRKIAPWISGLAKRVQLEEVPAIGGMPAYVGSISDLYPGSRRGSDRLDKSTQTQALEAYKRFVLAYVTNPGLKAFDCLTSRTENAPTVTINIPRVFKDNSVVGYGMHVVRTGTTGQKENVYLFLGGCRMDARSRFEQPLREAGYESRKR
jgi:hypothetical protein